jgi:hypothetical protein
LVVPLAVDGLVVFGGVEVVPIRPISPVVTSPISVCFDVLRAVAERLTHAAVVQVVILDVHLLATLVAPLPVAFTVPLPVTLTVSLLPALGGEVRADLLHAGVMQVDRLRDRGDAHRQRAYGNGDGEGFDGTHEFTSFSGKRIRTWRSNNEGIREW